MCLRLRPVWIHKIYFKPCQQLRLFFVVIYYKNGLRTLWQYLRIQHGCQRATLAKVKKHITHPRRLVTVLSHCQWVLFTAVLFPLPSATGYLLFLDPPHQMIYFSLFCPDITDYSEAIQFGRYSFTLQGRYIYWTMDSMSCCIFSLLFSCLEEWIVLYHQGGFEKCFLCYPPLLKSLF